MDLNMQAFRAAQALIYEESRSVYTTRLVRKVGITGGKASVQGV